MPKNLNLKIFHPSSLTDDPNAKGANRFVRVVPFLIAVLQTLRQIEQQHLGVVDSRQLD
jgi:hypothetical protein